jgi:KaiC/GvpD/RAD55 family RecA-like ATPase
MEPEVARMIDACGGFSNTLRALMSFSRAFWHVCTDGRQEQESKNSLYQRDVQISELCANFVSELATPASERPLDPERLFDVLVERIATIRVGEDLRLGWVDDGRGKFLRSIANPLDLIRAVLRDARPDHELRYFAMKQIREHYDIFQSAAFAHRIHSLAANINGLIYKRSQQRVSWNVKGEILPVLESSLRHSDSSAAICQCFLEISRCVNYIRLSWKPKSIEFIASLIDGEYMLSRLFGLPTRIKGLDELFGGGGIMLGYSHGGPQKDGDKRMGGRAVVTVGPFGSAKSLLALQLAVEVARKGGAAWVMPLEQSAEECLYTLESMGCLQDDARFTVATTVPKAVSVCQNPEPEKGVLILLRTVKESFEDFLIAFKGNVTLMDSYALRLIIVDPINAMTYNTNSDRAENRGRLLSVFESVKQAGTNIWLVSEESHSQEPLLSEQNIADTVIRLSSENRHGYSQRYIEITKSRMQREQRGKHAFTIGPGKGITIYPSSAAVRARLRMRSDRTTKAPVKFGLPSLDEILGEPALYAGDVIVLQGPGGSFKTPVGLSFLLNCDPKEKPGFGHRSLLVSARDDEQTVRHSLRQFRRAIERDKPPESIMPLDDVNLAVIEGGYVKPGYVLQRIEDEFLSSRLNNRPIGRVMIDNIGHWGFSCPYIREDETFGDTLIELLRRHGVTSIITCGEPGSHPESVLQRSVLDNADCLIQFERVEFRGASRIMIRILKTRDMSHRRDYFELLSNSDSLEVKTVSSLVRIGLGGSVSKIKLRLFLHSESDSQTVYNRSILRAVRSTLSEDARLEAENPIQANRALSLGVSSSVDELQVLQIDEFQLPRPESSAVDELNFFPESAFKQQLWNVIPRIRHRAQRGKSHFAIPYYANVGLLAYRRGVPSGSVRSWESLGRECEAWEADHPSPDEIYFDFPMVSSENHNVLFLEILLWLAGPPAKVPDNSRSAMVFRDWLTSEAALKANVIMNRLCRRAFVARHEPSSLDISQKPPFRVNLRAHVWRHWYSTLNQMLSEMTPADRADIALVSLPGNVSVAGEWFMGVPRHSAAPDVGMRLIQLCTSPEAMIDRLMYGVGLPVQKSFYENQGGSGTSISPFISLDAKLLLSTIENAFERSSFECYRRYASILAAHLRSVLLLSARDEPEFESIIRGRLLGLRERLAQVEN